MSRDEAELQTELIPYLTAQTDYIHTALGSAVPSAVAGCDDCYWLRCTLRLWEMSGNKV